MPAVMSGDVIVVGAGQAAAQQERTTEHDGVGADHPLQVVLAEMKVGLDRRQSDVHDGDIEHHHELRRHDHREGQPLAPSVRVCRDW